MKLYFGDCPNKTGLFRFHDWEYRSEYKEWGKSHWLHDVLVAVKGNNIIETNKRYVCTSCYKVEKI